MSLIAASFIARSLVPVRRGSMITPGGMIAAMRASLPTTRALAAGCLVCLLAGPAYSVGPDWLFADGFDPAANRDSPLGTNLDGVTDFSSSYNFVDVFKQSRSWITADTQNFIFDTGDDACLDLD